MKNADSRVGMDSRTSMKTILLNKRYYKVPASWNEMNQKQLLQAMDILFVKGYKAEQMLLRLVQCITGLSDYRFFKCDIEEVEEFFYLGTFMLNPDIAFTKNILSEYKFSHTMFYGPADRLDNLKMKEFTLTEDLYIRWFDSEKKDIEALNEMVAILYRPAPAKYNFKVDPNGDCREPFNQNTSAYYARTYVRDWPLRVKLAIATWYNGCRINIVQNNPEVFNGSEEDSSRYGLVSVMLNVAETNVFGDFAKVEDQYVGLVMMQLNETVDKAKRLEKSVKS